MDCSAWDNCKRCGLHRFRRRVVVSEGSFPADVLFIGEGPGKTEDLRGRPFVGSAGNVLRAAIAKARELSGSQASVHLTNIVACRPTDKKGGDNREPSQSEALACMPRLLKVEKEVAPKEIVLLGQIPARFAGSLFPTATRTFHPSYIARRGGTSSSEFRTLVRVIVDVFASVDKRNSRHIEKEEI